MISSDDITLYLVAISMGLVVLFLLREVVAWYNKTNEQIKHQKEIIRLLKKVAREEEPLEEPGEV